jgi:hypothetical protein
LDKQNEWEREKFQKNYELELLKFEEDKKEREFAREMEKERVARERESHNLQTQSFLSTLTLLVDVLKAK